MSQMALYRAVWIPSALACIGLSMMYLRQPYQVPPPEPMKSYVTKDKNIAIDHPGNWKPHTSALHSIETDVVFKPSKTVLFTVSYGLVGSLMADISRSAPSGFDSGNGMTPEGMQGQLPEGQVPGGQTMSQKQKTPLEKLHDANGKTTAANKEFSEYVEEQTVPAQLSGQEALVTDFSCQIEQQRIVGKRVTALMSDGSISVLCYCPKEMEKVIKPQFIKMLESLRAGPAVGQMGGQTGQGGQR